MGPTSKCFLLRLGLSQLWGAITLRADLWLRWGIQQSCSPHREPFNGMLHAICTHGNRVDIWLLVVGSQIANLIPDPSFGHNLCCRCPNEKCEPILDIYVPRTFQWYKKLLKPLSFDPCSCPLKIQKSTGTPTPKVELPWGVRVHSLTPSRTPRNMLYDSRLPFWPTTLQTLVLVASPRLGLRHMPLPWTPHHEHKVNSKNMNNNELGQGKTLFSLGL
jgi:hypothetical protein